MKRPAAAPSAVYLLLLFVPVSMACYLAGNRHSVLIFILSALAIIPLAGVIGRATEAVAAHVGPVFGALLNSTFGNATELIIGLFALHAGEVDLVRASIAGSII